LNKDKWVGGYYLETLNLVMKVPRVDRMGIYPVVVEDTSENGMRLKIFRQFEFPQQTEIILSYKDNKYEYEFTVRNVMPVSKNDKFIIVTKPQKVAKRAKRMFERLDINSLAYCERWDKSTDRYDITVVNISGGGCTFVSDYKWLWRDTLRFGMRLNETINLVNICGVVVRVNPIGDDFPLPDLFLGATDRSGIYEVGFQFTIISASMVEKIDDYVKQRKMR